MKRKFSISLGMLGAFLAGTLWFYHTPHVTMNRIAQKKMNVTTISDEGKKIEYCKLISAKGVCFDKDGIEHMTYFIDGKEVSPFSYGPYFAMDDKFAFPKIHFLYENQFDDLEKSKGRKHILTLKIKDSLGNMTQTTREFGVE